MSNDPTQPQGTNKPLYRGGPDLTPRDIDIAIDRSTGMLRTSKGVSLNADPSKVEGFGGAFQVDMESVPDQLRIVQRGRDLNHFEIVPAEPMTHDNYADLLKQIRLIPPKP